MPRGWALRWALLVVAAVGAAATVTSASAMQAQPAEGMSAFEDWAALVGRDLGGMPPHELEQRRVNYNMNTHALAAVIEGGKNLAIFADISAFVKVRDSFDLPADDFDAMVTGMLADVQRRVDAAAAGEDAATLQGEDEAADTVPAGAAGDGSDELPAHGYGLSEDAAAAIAADMAANGAGASSAASASVEQEPADTCASGGGGGGGCAAAGGGAAPTSGPLPTAKEDHLSPKSPAAAAAARLHRPRPIGTPSLLQVAVFLAVTAALMRLLERCAWIVVLLQITCCLCVTVGSWVHPYLRPSSSAV